MKKITFSLLINIIFILAISDVYAGVVKGNYVGCLTEEYLDNLQTALAERDNRLYKSLMGKVCVSIKGREFSILDRGFLRSKLRVYVGENYVDLWTPSEAAR